VQLVIRSTSYETAREKADQAVEAMEAVINQVIGGVPYLSIMALSAPGYLGHDESNRAEIVVSFEVLKGRG
jgi:hypothetical protein